MDEYDIFIDIFQKQIVYPAKKRGCWNTVD